MWADSLLDLERSQLLRLLVWCAGNVLVGTTLLLVLAARRHLHSAPLLQHFAIQTIAWSAIAGISGLAWWQSLQLREYSGLLRLVNRLWLLTGLEVGLIATGATLALYAWRSTRVAPRFGAVGAGIGMVLQGLAFLLLSYGLLVAIGPLR